MTILIIIVVSVFIYTLVAGCVYQFINNSGFDGTSDFLYRLWINDFGILVSVFWPISFPIVIAWWLGEYIVNLITKALKGNNEEE